MYIRTYRQCCKNPGYWLSIRRGRSRSLYHIYYFNYHQDCHGNQHGDSQTGSQPWTFAEVGHGIMLAPCPDAVLCNMWAMRPKRQRNAMECHGMPWNAMECHGMPWNAMECHGMPWNAMECIYWRLVIIRYNYSSASLATLAKVLGSFSFDHTVFMFRTRSGPVPDSRTLDTRFVPNLKASTCREH